MAIWYVVVTIVSPGYIWSHLIRLGYFCKRLVNIYISENEKVAPEPQSQSDILEFSRINKS